MLLSYTQNYEKTAKYKSTNLDHPVSSCAVKTEAASKQTMEKIYFGSAGRAAGYSRLEASLAPAGIGGWLEVRLAPLYTRYTQTATHAGTWVTGGDNRAHSGFRNY